VLLGFNKALVNYNVEEKTTKRHELASLFFKLIHLPTQAKIIIFIETGVQCLDESGDLLWSVDSDVIESHTLNENVLILRCMDDSVLNICIDNGKVN
jgi:urease accessory protein UreE